MKNRITAFTITALFAVGLYITFFNESTTDAASKDSADFDVGNALKPVYNNINTHNKHGMENKSQVSNGAQLNDSSQAFNYGECYVYDQDEETKLQEKRENHLRTLSNYSNKEEQLAYIIFGNIVPDNASALEEKYQHKIDSLLDIEQIEKPLIAIETLRSCTLHSDYVRCNNALIEKVTSQHKNDAEIWLQALRYYLNTDQDELAFRAIEQAKQSKYASSFLYEFVNAYTQTMENAGIGSYNSNVSNALGYYFAKTPPYLEPTAWCRDNVGKEKYAQGCLDMGALLEQKSSDKFDKLTGIAFQKMVHQAEGNTDLVKLAQQREENFYPRNLTSNWRTQNEVLETIFQYEKLLKAYIFNMETLGEHGSLKALEPEVMAFRASEQYVDCGDL